MNIIRTFGRRKPAAPVEAATPTTDAEMENPETLPTETDTDNRMQQRLNRLKQAQSEKDDPQHISAEANANFEIDEEYARNAFLVLKIPFDAPHDRIHEAVDDLSFEPDSDPRLLEDAQARLISARDRLAEEMRWMPECDPERQAEIRLALNEGNVEKLSQFRQETSGLARLNLTLIGNDFRASDIEAASNLVRYIAKWDTDRTRDLLDEARARGGFKPIDASQWNETLTATLSDFAKQVTPTFTSTAMGQGKLIALVREIGGDVLLADFFEAIQKYYSAGVEKKMGQVSVRLDETMKMIRVTPNNKTLINTLISLLGQWSSYRRPIQVMEAARSLDDQVSSEMFETVKDLTIHLANEHNLFETALMIAESLFQHFTHLPNCRSQLESQMPVLRSNVGTARLVIAAKNAKVRARKFASSVLNGGLEHNDNDLVSDVVHSFEMAVDNIDSKRDDMFMIVRDVTIDAYNVSQQKPVVLMIYEWLLEYEPSFELSNILHKDLKKIGLNIPAEYRTPE